MAKHLELILYPEDGYNSAKIEEIIGKYSSIKQFAYILHDKDVTANGELKKPHYHLYTNFGSSSVTIESIARWFDVPTSHVQRIKGSKQAALLYLYHANAPDKYQYDVKDIKANFDVASFLTKCETKLSLNELIEQCAAGSITPHNYHQYIAPTMYACHEAKFQRAWEYGAHANLARTNGKRKCSVYWVYGNTATGKSTLCSMVSEKLGLELARSATGNDPFSQYLGEPALLLDDLKPQDFKFSELLRILDPNYTCAVHSRYHDKVLATNVIFVTSVYSPWDFAGAYTLPESDDAAQLYRRITELWHVTKDTVEIIKYCMADRSFKLVGSKQNPVPLLFSEANSGEEGHNSEEIFDKILLEIKGGQNE